MKLVLSAVAATAAFAAVAMAQTTPAAPLSPPAPPAQAVMTSACPDLPAEPILPELTGMRRNQVKDFNDKTMEPWRVRADQILQCRNNEIRGNDAILNQKKAEYDALLAATKAMLDANRANKARADALIGSWNAKVTAFESKGGSNSRNDGATGRNAR